MTGSPHINNKEKTLNVNLEPRGLKIKIKQKINMNLLKPIGTYASQSFAGQPKRPHTLQIFSLFCLLPVSTLTVGTYDWRELTS